MEFIDLKNIKNVSEYEKLEQAGKIIREGGLVLFPTETVYGLGAIATKEKSVKGVYAAKGRPSDNPLIVTVSD